jgi:hypothetical protein
VLVDPYLSRFSYRSPLPPPCAGTCRTHPSSSSARTDTDHLADVPHLLDRPDRPAARIRTIATETGWHLPTGLGLSARRRPDVAIMSRTWATGVYRYLDRLLTPIAV